MIQNLKKMKILINANIIFDYDALYMSIKNIESYKKNINSDKLENNSEKIFKENLDIVKPRSHSIEFCFLKSRKINFGV